MRKVLFLVLFIFLYFSCVSIDLVKTTETIYNPTNAVEVFWEKPSFDYITIGRYRVTGEFASESSMINKLIKRAKIDGVKGLVILNTAEDDSLVWTESGVMTIDTIVIHALAITY